MTTTSPKKARSWHWFHCSKLRAGCSSFVIGWLTNAVRVILRNTKSRWQQILFAFSWQNKPTKNIGSCPRNIVKPNFALTLHQNQLLRSSAVKACRQQNCDHGFGRTITVRFAQYQRTVVWTQVWQWKIKKIRPADRCVGAHFPI